MKLAFGLLVRRATQARRILGGIGTECDQGLFLSNPRRLGCSCGACKDGQPHALRHPNRRQHHCTRPEHILPRAAVCCGSILNVHKAPHALLTPDRDLTLAQLVAYVTFAGVPSPQAEKIRSGERHIHTAPCNADDSNSAYVREWAAIADDTSGQTAPTHPPDQRLGPYQNPKIAAGIACMPASENAARICVPLGSNLPSRSAAAFISAGVQWMGNEANSLMTTCDRTRSMAAPKEAASSASAVIGSARVSTSAGVRLWRTWQPKHCVTVLFQTTDQPTDSAGCAREQNSHRLSFSPEKKIVVYPF